MPDDRVPTSFSGPPPEDVADRLLDRALGVEAAEVFGDEADATAADLAVRKEAADLLVANKMARFADDARTRIALTNAGRYWAGHGGFSAFAREDPAGGRGKGRNPELEELRANYMRLRLNTFWWTFGLSVASFIISIISLTVAAIFGRSLLP